jgi:hypothetical protein
MKSRFDLIFSQVFHPKYTVSSISGINA